MHVKQCLMLFRQLVLLAAHVRLCAPRSHTMGGLLPKINKLMVENLCLHVILTYISSGFGA